MNKEKASELIGDTPDVVANAKALVFYGTGPLLRQVLQDRNSFRMHPKGIRTLRTLNSAGHWLDILSMALGGSFVFQVQPVNESPAGSLVRSLRIIIEQLGLKPKDLLELMRRYHTSLTNAKLSWLLPIDSTVSSPLRNVDRWFRELGITLAVYCFAKNVDHSPRLITYPLPFIPPSISDSSALADEFGTNAPAPSLPPLADSGIAAAKEMLCQIVFDDLGWTTVIPPSGDYEAACRQAIRSAETLMRSRWGKSSPSIFAQLLRVAMEQRAQGRTQISWALCNALLVFLA